MTDNALAVLASAFEAAAAVLRGAPTPAAAQDPLSSAAATTATAAATSTQSPTSDPASAAPQPQKRGRGRPAKGETAAPVQAEQPAAAPAVQDAGDFLGLEPARSSGPDVTLQDVKAALVVAQVMKGQPEALAILKNEGKADTLAQLKPENYGAVFAKAIPSGKLSHTDVRAVLVKAQERIGGPKALEIMKEKGGVTQLPALTEDKFVAVILAAHEAK